TASTRTKAAATPYQVDITQAAQQGSIAATNALAPSTVLTASNNTLTISVDGTNSGTLTLPPGTYTPLALAQQLQAQINASSTLSGRQATVALSGTKLTITSASYGSNSKVTIGTGPALTPLGFAGTETGNGTDVAGNFLVNGAVEPAV